MAAASFQALAPDREVLLAVGVSSPMVARDWHGADYPAKPLAQIREFIALLRECLSGTAATFPERILTPCICCPVWRAALRFPARTIFPLLNAGLFASACGGRNAMLL
jgi:alkanesulfonate monooxygenase SsuD/methylene tetrahydromethanopterin reductase-like flavin-dependent oxidoreductase (luciferase family)